MRETVLLLLKSGRLQGSNHIVYAKCGEALCTYKQSCMVHCIVGRQGARYFSSALTRGISWRVLQFKRCGGAIVFVATRTSAS